MNAKMDQCVSKMQNVSTQQVATGVTVNLATGSHQLAAALVSTSGVTVQKVVDFKSPFRKMVYQMIWAPRTLFLKPFRASHKHSGNS